MLTRKAFSGANTTVKRQITRTVHTQAASTEALPRTHFKGDDAFQFSPILNGCWQLAGGHGRDVYDDIMTKLDTHADAGFTTFDTADIYGPSERILGDFIRARDEAGKPPVQVFTKYVPDIFRSRPTPATVEAAIKKSCAALQVQQLDLVQLHWWEYSIPGMVDVSKALADCQAKGLIKHVATTNMDCKALESIIDAGVPIVANQVQFSLLDRRPLNGMLQLCDSQGIKLLTYGSVGGGLLSDKHVCEKPKTSLFGASRWPTVDLNTSSLKMYWNVTREFGGQDLWRELLQVLRRVADRHGPNTTVANVALKWVMQQGSGKNVHPVVGLRSTAHIADNAHVLSLTLTQQDMAEIGEVLKKSSGPKGDIYSFERGN